MKYGQIKCTNCGADLEVDLDKGFAICPYCENKMYANYSDNLLIEKEKTKQKIYELGKEIEKTRQLNMSNSSYFETKSEYDFSKEENTPNINNNSNIDKELDESINGQMILLFWLVILLIFHFIVFDNIFNY